MILFNYFFLLNKYKDNKLIYSQQYNVLKIEWYIKKLAFYLI